MHLCSVMQWCGLVLPHSRVVHSHLSSSIWNKAKNLIQLTSSTIVAMWLAAPMGNMATGDPFPWLGPGPAACSCSRCLTSASVPDDRIRNSLHSLQHRNVPSHACNKVTVMNALKWCDKNVWHFYDMIALKHSDMTCDDKCCDKNMTVFNGCHRQFSRILWCFYDMIALEQCDKTCDKKSCDKIITVKSCDKWHQHDSFNGELGRFQKCSTWDGYHNPNGDHRFVHTVNRGCQKVNHGFCKVQSILPNEWHHSSSRPIRIKHQFLMHVSKNSHWTPQPVARTRHFPRSGRDLFCDQTT